MAGGQAEAWPLGWRSDSPIEQVAYLLSHLALHRENDVGIDIQGRFHAT